MTHFAVIAPPLAGHLNPLLVLARELVRRKHRVSFVNQPDVARLVVGSGMDFLPVGIFSHPPGSLERRRAAMGSLSGLFGLRGMIAEVARFTDTLCREVPAVLGEIGADVVIGDQLEPAAGLIAEYLDLPLVTVATALPINREPAVPPPYVSWPYDPSGRGRWRNQGGYRVSDLLMRRIGATIEGHARAFGLRPRRRIEDCMSSLAQIAQAVPGIDFPRLELPGHFHYVGPLRDEADEDFDLPHSDGRPLVFCSLGTLQGSREKLFHAVASACAALDLRLLIAHAGRLAPRAIATLPGRPMVFDFVPQRAVLRQAGLAVTHGGFNTVLDSLAAGVPLVVVPIAFEQPATAARLVRAGVAKAIPYPRATAKRLLAAMREALCDDNFRSRARQISNQIAVAGGVRRAADIAVSTAIGSLSPTAPKATATREETVAGDAHDDSRNGSRSAAI